MAVEIPPWLNVGPQTYLQAAESGMRLNQQAQQFAAQMDMERQRMAQQAAMAKMELQVKQDMAEQSAQREQQKLLIDQAAQQAELGLRTASLDQTKQQFGLVLQQQAAKTQAQMRYAARMQQLTSQGQEPGEAASQALLEIGPSLGVPLSGLGQLAHAMRTKATVPQGLETVIDEDSGEEFYKTPQGYRQVVPHKQQDAGQVLKPQDTLRGLQNQLKVLKETLPYATGEDTKKSMAKQIKNVEKRIYSLLLPQASGTQAAPSVDATKPHFTFDKKTRKLMPVKDEPSPLPEDDQENPTDDGL